MVRGKEIYFNKPQRIAQLVGAKTTVIVAGRRTGKTDSIAAPFMLRNMQRMPGSTGGIVVPTFRHGLTNTIPGLLTAWKRWGYIEGVHFVIGRRPPKSFATPIIDPKYYEFVISFYNGSVAVILSQDRPGAANSLTLSWVLVDEAKFIDFAKLKDEVFPANGGIKSHFGVHSFNHSLMILSDMPQSSKGSWFLHYREKMDQEVIDAILGGVTEIWQLKQRVRQYMADGQEPPGYLRGRIRALDRDVNRLRSVAVFYKEYSSIENIQLIGENYIRDMKRDLTPLTFQTSILCKRIGIRKDGFYSSMRERNKYNASDFAYLDSFRYKMDGISLDCRADADLQLDKPICIGMDYNDNINWIVAAQPYEDKLLVIKSFYVKYERKLRELVDDFCAYYFFHRKKIVIFYFDTTAVGSNYAVNEQDYHWVVKDRFEKHGWEVRDVYLGHPMRHDEKHLLINRAFTGQQRLMPMFNRQNNDDLILAMETAGVSRGRLGFRKDKAGEKLAENEEDLLQHRTDGTDAFDTVYIGCEKFPQTVDDFYTINGIA